MQQDFQDANETHWLRGKTEGTCFSEAVPNVDKTDTWENRLASLPAPSRDRNLDAAVSLFICKMALLASAPFFICLELNKEIDLRYPASS